MRWTGWIVAIALGIAIGLVYQNATADAKTRAAQLQSFERELADARGRIGTNQASQQAKIAEAQAKLDRALADKLELEQQLNSLVEQEKQARASIGKADASSEELKEQTDETDMLTRDVMDEQRVLKDEIAVLEKHIEQVKAMIPDVTPSR